MPSDRRYEARLRTTVSGVEVPKSLYDNLQILRAGGSLIDLQDYEGDRLMFLAAG